MGGHIGATWRIRLNRPSAAEMQVLFFSIQYVTTRPTQPAKR